MAKGGGGSGPTIAKAYVAIIPTTRDAQKNISKELVSVLDDAGKDAGKTGGDSIVGSLGSALSAGVSKVASAAKVVAGAGVAALGALTTAAYGAFSDWEQLSGGIETIFGEESAKAVLRNSRQAFSSVQMSANDYLNTVTSFSASLIQSLGGDTDKAASMADQAIADMADNANKMGSNIGSIQAAYQGFAKQNYSMLDNLKLGYGGTQAEMYRLMQDAAALNSEFAETAEFGIDENGHLTASFADITRAIHIVQENMGIAGASAQEAATTLEGSFNMMSAAWSNLIAAFGTGNAGAIEPALHDMTNSIMTWLGNAIPRIGLILRGIVREIPYIFQMIAERIPGWIASLSETFNAAVGQLMRDAMTDEVFTSIVSALSPLIESISGFINLDSITSMLTTARDVLEGIIGHLTNIASALLPAFLDIGQNILWPLIQGLGSLITESLLPKIEEYMPAITAGCEEIWGVLESMATTIGDLISAIADFLEPIIRGLFEFLKPVLDFLIDRIADIAGAIISAISDIWTNHFQPAVEALAQFFRDLTSWVQAHDKEIQAFLSSTLEVVKMVIQIISDTIVGLISGIKHILNGLIETVRAIFDIIVGVFTGDTQRIQQGLNRLIGGIAEAFWGLVEIITSPFRTAFNQIRDLWNSTIGGMGFTIPDWVPGVGGGSFRIPYMAEGGTITAAGTVLVGEQGPELLDLPSGARVRPLSADDMATSETTSYSVMVGDVNLSDDDEVRRITRAYLEQLARLASPGGLVMA